MRPVLKIIGTFSVACLALASANVFADYNLNKDASSVNFLSTKNTNITESHTFDEFNGKISDDGKLELNVDLTSVNTLIPIRNERMQSMLFDVTNFATASFTAQLDKAMMDLKAGETKNASITGDLSISGQTHPITFDVVITGLGDGKLSAATSKPSIINASQYGLDGGIDALREVAMLKNISSSVPFSFYVVFEG